MVGDRKLCNRRYAEMHELSPRLAQPGTTLHEVVEHRSELGAFSGNADEYVSRLMSLAVQTAKATEEIAAQIQAVQGSSAGAVEAIGSITGCMREISEYTSAVEQQSAATSEISHNVSSAAQGTVLAVSALGEVAGAASATRTSAQTVLSASKSVESAVANLRGEVETFLGKVAI